MDLLHMSLLQRSFSGAVLILVIAVIRAAAINRLPKKTFLILWWIVLLRLLVPFSVSSAWSVYSILERNAPAWRIYEMPMDSIIPAGHKEQREMTEKDTASEPSAGEAAGLGFSAGPAHADGLLQPGNIGNSVSLWSVLWLVGTLLCGMFFAVSYLRCRLEFRTSLPVQNDFVKRWLKENRLMRPVSVRQSDRISAPLTYGILRPVILMPKHTDWKKEGQLSFVFLHEYVHIRRYDTATKLLIALALCIHWFNPFVWGMYVLFNRDMELACDESVVRRAGKEARSTYASMLISMEAEKSGLLPLCNHFSKNVIEERITAIMKIKKTSVFAVLTAAVLTILAAAAFGTTAAGGGLEKRSMPDESFSAEEYEKLFALQFEGYEDMSVAEYQDRVWEMTDTEEYRALLERFSGDGNDLYSLRDSDETASFLFYTLEPLTAERWRKRSFDGYVMTEYPDACDNAVLEFSFALTIENADTLTVREYNEARLGVTAGLQDILQGKTDEQLQDDGFMQKEIRAEIEALTDRWGSDRLQISVEYSYMPLSERSAEDGGERGQYPGGGEDQRQENDSAGDFRREQEDRDYPHATEEDYQSLFTLKTPDYQDRSVAEFNRDLLDWANEDYERMERIGGDAGYDDFAVALSDEERDFVMRSVWFSGAENGEYVQSNYTGRAEEDPMYNCYLPSKTTEKNGRAAWCDLFYQFSYHIADKEAITVGERDRCVTAMMDGAEHFWEERDIEQMLTVTEADISEELRKIAAECSDDRIVVTVKEDSVHFEKMDERDLEFE